MQIRYGLPELRKGAFVTSATPVNKLLFKIYRAIPFLLELKIITDWTFTKTSLDLFQWIQFETIYADLFIAKCENKNLMAHPLGEPIIKVKKFFIGGFALIGIVALVAGPLAIFSSLNPVAEANKVTGSTLKGNIEVGESAGDGVVNQYTIYENQYVTQLKDINDYVYKDKMELNTNLNTRNYDRDLYQVVEMNANSDSVWDSSPPNQQNLYDILDFTLRYINTTTLNINLNLYYTFSRPNPEGQIGEEAVVKRNILELDNDEREDILTTLRDSVNPDIDCEDSQFSFTLKNYYIPIIRLTTSALPGFVYIDELLTDVHFNKHCVVKDGVRKDYWSITQTNFTIDEDSYKEETGIIWVTISDKVVPYLLEYSVLTFYISVVLVVGSLIRSTVFEVSSHRVFIKCMSKPDQLLLLCEAIHISRLQNDTTREEELYFVLIDIMRSPEILKVITGTSIKKIKKD